MRFNGRSIVTLLFLAMVSALGGCLVTGTSNETRSGAYVPESTFSQIAPGKTTAGWVQATLGEPTSRSTADGNTVWKYTYTERKDSAGAVFLIFGGSNTQQTEHNAFVEFKDGVVVNKWRG